MIKILYTVGALIWIATGIYTFVGIRHFLKSCDRTVEEMRQETFSAVNGGKEANE